MGKVEVTPAAKGSRFWVLFLALVLAVATIAKIKEMGDPRPVPSTPVPTVTVTVEPSPLCSGAADSGCWETEDEVGPPWMWRETPKVRK